MDKSKNTLFVAGTDTGVGKTLVTALLALKIRQMGYDCGVYKPFASGCDWTNGIPEWEDAAFLKKWVGVSDSMDEICPIRLEEPLAPLIAAQRAGISTLDWPQRAREGLEHLRQKHEFIVVEGVGGLLAPLWETKDGFGSNLDLMTDWKIPAVLVARRVLGTINHTLLALRMAPFGGVIFNDACPVKDDDIAAQTGPDFIAKVVDVPVWGWVGYATEISQKKLERTAATLKLPNL